LASALTTLGHKAGVLGTLGNGVYGALEQSTHTTLDACTLQRSFAGFVENGVEFACIEASSHGLVQGRLNGTRIELALFTNLTRDHLDYHGTMENYAAAKEILFRWPNLKHAVLNADDSQSTHYKNVLSQSVKCWTYSVHPESHADIVALKIAPSLQGITLSVSTPIGVCDVKVALLGRFNVSNLLAVMAALIALDFSLEDIQSAFLALKPVRGRMECFMGDHPTVVVDYAHTPDALEKVLSNLREHAEGKLICVFGCGGDRDSGKRPVMGRIAYQLADYVVLTSDNPRTESPESILKEILAGMPADASIVVEANRHQAIAQAIAKAGAADIVLVAGKGHEDYQEVMGIRHHFDDAEEVRAALALWRAA
jgi:UDP-N-acetylmuramyl-tripeptide synthetase